MAFTTKVEETQSLYYCERLVTLNFSGGKKRDRYGIINTCKMLEGKIPRVPKKTTSYIKKWGSRFCRILPIKKSKKNKKNSNGDNGPQAIQFPPRKLERS